MSTLRAIKNLAKKANVTFGCFGNPMSGKCEACAASQQENITKYMKHLTQYKDLDLLKEPSEHKGLFIFHFKN